MKTKHRHVYFNTLCFVFLALSACDDTKPRNVSSNKDQSGSANESAVSVKNNTTAFSSRLIEVPPEKILNVDLPTQDGIQNKLDAFDEIERRLSPIFDSLQSNDPMKQRAALQLIGTPSGSISNAGNKYKTLSDEISHWAHNSSFTIPPDSAATPQVREAFRIRNRKFISVVESIILLHDANNSSPVKVALHALLGLPIPYFYRDNEIAMMQRWHELELYKKLVQN